MLLVEVLRRDTFKRVCRKGAVDSHEPSQMEVVMLFTIMQIRENVLLVRG